MTGIVWGNQAGSVNARNFSESSADLPFWSGMKHKHNETYRFDDLREVELACMEAAVGDLRRNRGRLLGDINIDGIPAACCKTCGELDRADKGGWITDAPANRGTHWFCADCLRMWLAEMGARLSDLSDTGCDAGCDSESVNS